MLKFKSNPTLILLTLLFVICLALWAVIAVTGSQDEPINEFYSFIYAVIPFYAGLVGLKNAYVYCKAEQKAKDAKESHAMFMAKAVLLFSLGLLTWGIGQFIWAYYSIFLKIETPYPSLADIGFIVSPPLWIVGLMHFTHAMDLRIHLANKTVKAILISIPLAVTLVAFYLIGVLIGDFSPNISDGIVKVFFDLAYPLFDTVLLIMFLVVNSLVFIDKLNYKPYKLPLAVLTLGMIFMFFSDIGLSYTSTLDLAYNGDVIDLLFTLAVFLISLGVNQADRINE